MSEPNTTQQVMSEIKSLVKIRVNFKGFNRNLKCKEIDEEIETILEHYKAGTPYKFKGIKGE